MVSTMIRGFRDKRTEAIWGGRVACGLPSGIQAVALRKLRLSNRAESLGDLKVPPGDRLEALEGERKVQHSIRVNDQWRVCFIGREGGAIDVEIVDYD
jgi:proteic killer suppression protein